MDRVLPAARLDEFMRRLEGAGFRVIVPVSSGPDLEFAEYDGTRPIALAGRTRFSVKEYLFPAQETLVTFDRRKPKEGTTASLPEETGTPTFVWGVRPCDIAGLAVLDRVFLSAPVDTGYDCKRKATVFGCLKCNQPGASCFCTSVGGSPHAGKGCDISFTDLGDRFLMEVGSDEGQRLIEITSDLLLEGTPQDAGQARELEAVAQKAMSLALDVEKLRQVLAESWDSDVWAKETGKCTICGTCSIVCPACHCFNVEDVMKRRGLIERVRYWDNCQFSGFTRMATSNSRPEQWQRWRHKIYDKFVYKPERYEGLLGCTGCGRCIDYCQGSINLVRVLERLTDG